MDGYVALVNALTTFMADGGADKGYGWSVGNFLVNLNKSLFSWGKIIVVIIGVVMVVVGVFNIAKGLMSGGKAQTNWVLNLALFFIGGALAFGGGWGLVEQVSKGGSDTLNDLGHDATTTVTKTVVLDFGEYNVFVD